ncbi:MAG: pirin family protein [Crocinitomicaceae bacterium]
MATKEIAAIVAPREPHFVGDGFRVHNFIPSMPGMDMKSMSPFIMLDYNSKYHFEPSVRPKGVGTHPHKGFETVTIAYKGKVQHRDSSGGGGIIGEGDVQWMTAGSGILHQEFHEVEFSKKGGDFQMVQLWVNLPAKDKKTAPKYQAIQNSEMPIYDLGDGSKIEVIAGDYKNLKGKAFTFTPVHLMNAKLIKGKKADFSFPADYTTFLLVLEGAITVNQTKFVATDHLLLFDRKGEDFSIEANENAVVLVLSGEPINEPIAAHGPFVMNTHEELVEAFNNFNQGKFGFLEE